MAHTTLLPPVSAVHLAWAFTGSFSNDDPSNLAAVTAEADWKRIQEQAAADPTEAAYIARAAAALDASRRSLETIYKGRTLNFDENATLREAYLEDAAAKLEFGTKARDFLQSLPTMTLTGAGGLTVAQAFELDDAALVGITLALAAAGFFINLIFVRLSRQQRQLEYVKQDYERNLYYEHYIHRAQLILQALYLDLQRLHQTVFQETYPTGEENIGKIIATVLSGVEPTPCQFVHKHMQEGKITPQLWSRCETGIHECVIECPHWEA